jgi:fumarate reductase subunit C
VPITESDLISPVENIEQSSSPSLLLSSAAFIGSLIEGACAILVASGSVKLLVGLGAVAAAVKASRLHADFIRIPVLLASAAAAVTMLLVCWNAWRARNRSVSRWRKRPLTSHEKTSFTLTLLASLVTLALVAGEALEHPFFHLH